MTDARISYITLNFAEVTSGTVDARISFNLLQRLSYHPDVYARCSYYIIQSLSPELPEPVMVDVSLPGFGNDTVDPTVPAAANPFRTNLPGLSFEIHKRPMFKTNVKEAASGKETRNALMEYPRWQYELNYEFLEDASGSESSLKTIMGFFLECRGSFAPFLFKDPDDYLVEAGVIGTGDGVTTVFPMVRYVGNFGEKVGQLDTDNDIAIYKNGVVVAEADYTLSTNVLTFDVAPADGVEITADFQFFFVCRFNEDSMDFEKWADKWWNLRSCEFRSIV